MTQFFFLVICRVLSEGWGQLRSSEIELTPMVKELDPSRPVLSVSGWRGALEKQFCMVKTSVQFHLRAITIQLYF
jgi:hypothetical protein